MCGHHLGDVAGTGTNAQASPNLTTKHVLFLQVTNHGRRAITPLKMTAVTVPDILNRAAAVPVAVTTIYRSPIPSLHFYLD